MNEEVTAVPEYSIIIPSHNGEDRIGKAIASVTDQSFRDYEIIVVCDACTDGTHRVAQEHGARVIDVDFHRDGLARNAGISEAHGRWILFLDDDDWFLHEFVLERLNASIGQHGEDMLGFSFIWRNRGYTRQDADTCFKMVWGYCWKASFIRDMHFSSVAYGADSVFFDDAMKRNPTIVFIDEPMYYYNYMREGSMTWRKERGETQ